MWTGGNEEKGGRALKEGEGRRARTRGMEREMDGKRV